MRGIWVLIYAIITWSTAAQAMTARESMDLCRNAAIRSADAHGIPREVLVAITLVETRTRRGGVSGPWPWTVNVAGKGAWFDTRASALLHAQSARARGQMSFDVGCFQLNYRWHGEHFASIAEMFDPARSGDYAARFLKSLHEESGDWITAAGHYHSRTPVHARRYRGLVRKAANGLGVMADVDPAPARAPVRPRVTRLAEANLWPLDRIRIRRPGNGATAGSVELRMFRTGKPLAVRNGAARGG